MTFDDFKTANMYPAWNGILADNVEVCRTCHENGAEGFMVSGIEQKMFDTIKGHKYYALEFFTYSSSAPTLHVTANTVTMDGVSKGLDPHREHPRFEPGSGLISSDKMAQLTQARYDASGGNCP